MGIRRRGGDCARCPCHPYDGGPKLKATKYDDGEGWCLFVTRALLTQRSLKHNSLIACSQTECITHSRVRRHVFGHMHARTHLHPPAFFLLDLQTTRTRIFSLTPISETQQWIPCPCSYPLIRGFAANSPHARVRAYAPVNTRTHTQTRTPTLLHRQYRAGAVSAASTSTQRAAAS